MSHETPQQHTAPSLTTPTTGLFIIDKPYGITSAKALYRMRFIVKEKKSGHAGTLDPLATGVLILCFKRATKMVESIMHLPKVYRTVARLDVTTDSYDLEKPLIPVDVATIPTASELETVASQFVGPSMQVPPASSAVKVGGQPAYKKFRKGKPIELAPKPINIYWLRILRYEWPELAFEMCCSRGTYVRSLIRDLGAALGTGGCLTALQRSQIGPFTLHDAHTLEEIADSPHPWDHLVPIEAASARIDAWMSQPIPAAPRHDLPAKEPA